MFESLKKLLDKFPYFLDKGKGSNFTKSERVFNNRFTKVYNDLFEVYLSGKIDKKVFIWKEQSVPYSYSMNFLVLLPDLKEVKVEKVTISNEDNIEEMEIITDTIYRKSYEKGEEYDYFHHIEECHEETPLPKAKYIITAITYDEMELVKGFPENDTEIGNIYDHDNSLDEFGAFINLPRLQFVATDDYANTVPPFHEQLSEDDYHYFQRIVYFLAYRDKIPLPVLEIWKTLCIPTDEITMINRETILCKMFDKGLHGREDWIPSKWEHKDTMCSLNDEDYYFFANVNDNTPLERQDIKFTFSMVSSFGVPSNEEYFIVPYINGEAQDIVLSSKHKWTVNTSLFNNESATFYFKCYESMTELEENTNPIVSDEIAIVVRGCNNANFYVKPTGDDANDGLTRKTAFKTIEKACSMVEGENNVISLTDGTYGLSDTVKISENTKIVGCSGSNPILQFSNSVLFDISQQKTLLLQNVSASYHGYKTHYDSETFFNDNKNQSYMKVVSDLLEIVALDTSDDVDIVFTDDKIIFNKLEADWDWVVKISDTLDSTVDISIIGSGENPNLIVRDG